jgi:hypothetical protein
VPEFDRHRCIFVHVPKTAGISVIHSLFGAYIGGHRTAAEYRRIYRSDFDRFLTFAFVRDPWSRLSSAFRFLKRGGVNELDTAWAAEHLAPYETLDQFVLGWLTDEAVRAGSPHFRPQGHFLCDRRGRVLIDFVGRFERLEEDFSTVCRRLGLERELGSQNRGVPADQEEELSTEAREIVRRVYEADFRLFDYPLDPAPM